MSGIGMTSTRTRTRMVERLRAEGIRDEVVLEAMNAIPRHIFVDEALAIRAYEDTPLPIGSGQTISQPWVVARMSELARAGRTLERVLEIGTGCGYQTAVLAQIAAEVYTVERIGALVAKARRNLQSLKVKNVRLMHGDGTADLGEDLAVRRDHRHGRRRRTCPTRLLKYLKPGGRMVLPLAQHGESGDGVQRLTVIEADARRPPRADVRCGKICSVAARARLESAVADAAARVSPVSLPPRSRPRCSAARPRCSLLLRRGVRVAHAGPRRGPLAAPRRCRRLPRPAPEARPGPSPTGDRRPTR